jgi:threonine synthase
MADVKFLKCVKCGREYNPDEVLYTCPHCGTEGTLYVLYDYNSLKRIVTRDFFKTNYDYSLWRYTYLLPIEKKPRSLTLQVGWTPLYRAKRIENALGLNFVYIKDDGKNPTASFKDRASAVGVAKAIELNKNIMCAASTGNAASSLSGFAACAGIETYIFVPSTAPEAKIAQLLIYGSNVILVDGTYDEAFELCLKASMEFGWYNRSCAVNPYLLEGKKTVSFEIAEQMGWDIPDTVIMSVGDGCCISGAWKGFKELHALGLIERLPRMIGVQASGSNPVIRAFREGKNYFEYKKPQTIADSISVGIPRNGLKALNALRESGGGVVDVTDCEILSAMKSLARFTGVFGEPAGVAGFAALTKMAQSGDIKKDEKVLTVVTGSGLKDIRSAMSAVNMPCKIKPDMEELRKLLHKE